MRVLTVNAGSTSLKLAEVDDGQVTHAPDSLEVVFADRPPDVIAHRVVHGGERTTSEIVDDTVLEQLRMLTDLAPLHQTPALDALERCRAKWPGIANVACFDTAFHSTIPEAARTYALPRGCGRWCVCTASTACRMRGPSAGPMPSRPTPAGWWSPTSGVARRCARRWTVAASSPRWGSPLSTDWSWRRGAEPSIPAPSSGFNDTRMRTSATCSNTRAAFSDSAARATCASCTSASQRATPTRRWRSRYGCTARSLSSAVASRHSVVSTRWSSPAGSESTTTSRAALAESVAWLGVGLDDTRAVPSGEDCEISSGASTVRAFVIRSREDLQLAAEATAVIHRVLGTRTPPAGR